MSEHINEKYDAVSEIYKLKKLLTLTGPEIQNWERYINYCRQNKNATKYKRCNICGKIKSLDKFYTNILKKFGVSDRCKECAKVQAEIQVLKKRVCYKNT